MSAISTYTLLVIYTDGTEVEITGVNDHGVDRERSSYMFSKNGRKGYFPTHAIRFFGSKFDYKNMSGRGV